jgi:WD40 repeat protein
MKAMKNISSAENHDQVEMKVFYLARKIYVSIFIKAMLMIMILGLVSLFSKLWAQVPAESMAAVNQESTAGGKRMLAEWRSWYFEHQQNLESDMVIDSNNAGMMAESSEREKARLLYLSTAQNMAIKSLNVNDRSLQGIMAQQAYLLNGKYEGNPSDSHIYDGLYYALKSLTDDSLYLLSGHRGVVRDLAISSVGDQLFSAATDGKIMDWDLGRPNSAGHVKMSSEYSRCRVVKITSDDRWVIAGTDASSIYCFDQKRKDSNPHIIKGHNGSIVDLAVMPDNRYFVSLSSDHTLRINDLVNRRGRLLKKLYDPYVRMAISRDGKYLALAAENGKLIVLDMKNGYEEYVVFPAGGPAIRSIAFNPACDILAAGNTRGDVNIIELSIMPWLVFTQLRGHNADANINDVAFSEDGAYLASGGFDGTILLWDMNNADNHPMVFRDNNTHVWSLAFSHDSEYLYAGCEDGSIKVWPTRTELMSSQLTGKLTRNMTREEWLRYASLEGNIFDEQTFSSVNP